MANEFRKVTDQNGVDHPVADDNRVDWSSYAKTGAVNFMHIPSDIVTISPVGTGVTYTVNRNSAGEVTSIKKTGNASSEAYFNIFTNKSLVTDKEYKFTCSPSGGGNNKYITYISDGSNTYQDTGDGVLIPAGSYNVYIRVFAGYNSDIDFLPMLALPEYKGPFVPYVMTNQQLTEKKVDKGRTLSSSDNLNDIKGTGIYSITTAPTNSPEGFCSLIVDATASDSVRQMLIKGGANASIYIMSFGGEPATWTSWVKFTGTVVS